MRNLDAQPLKEPTVADQNSRVENGQIDLVYSSILALGIVWIWHPDWITSIWLFFGIRFAYYFFFEWLFQKTPGKWHTQTLVVSHENQPKALQLAIRNCTRFFAGISLIGDQPYLLHDKLSNTQVVKDDLQPKKTVIPSKKLLKKILTYFPILLYILASSYAIDQDEFRWRDIVNIIMALLLIMVFLFDLIKWYRSKS